MKLAVWLILAILCLHTGNAAMLILFIGVLIGVAVKTHG